MTERPARKLAVILHADVVGSSALVQVDETLAHQRIQDAFKRLAATVSLYGGTAHEIRGDALVAEFARVSDAVCATLAAQSANTAHNETLTGPIRPVLRAGIAMGEVLVAEHTITGAGVVLAQRLEQLAEPGGVCIQGAAYETVPRRLPFEYESLGERQLKGFDEAVRAYAVRPRPDATIPGPESVAHGEPHDGQRAAKPSIAVLPFTNVSDDPDQEYLADGIAEDLITVLGRCRWLLVIARNSTFSYKGVPADIRRVARELGVRYVVEGSVRQSAGRVRVSVHLADGHDGSHLWSERYDGRIDDVFELQDQVSTAIAGAIKPELESADIAKLQARATNDLNAWTSYQRGMWHLYRFDAEELQKAKGFFEHAIELDAAFSQAHARLAYVYIQLGWYGRRDERARRVADAARLARHAATIDGRDPAARLSLGRALTLSGEVESGIEALRTAVELDPSFAQARFALGQALCSLDRCAEALREIDMAIRLSPRDPHLWTFLHVRAIALYIAGELGAAEAAEHDALRQPNVTFYPYTVLMAILGRQGRVAEAREALVQLRRLRPGFGFADAIDEWHFGERAIMTPRFMDQFAADLRSAGLGD